MTEADWLVSNDPTAMLAQVGEHAGERKLRLFACACCRLLWRDLIDERSRAAVEAAERHADGLLSDEELQAAFRQASRAAIEIRGHRILPAATTLLFRRPRDPERLFRAAFLAGFAAGDDIGDVQLHIHRGAGHPLDAPTRARILRCLLGNPFRPIASRVVEYPTHLVAWAHGIYDERAFDEMPILGDALDEAGCTDQPLLDHLRDPGVHVRGCWAIDRLTGRN
jgi:hypothetical protein